MMFFILMVGKITVDFTLEEVTGETRVPKDSLFVLGDNRIRLLSKTNLSIKLFTLVQFLLNLQILPHP